LQDVPFVFLPLSSVPKASFPLPPLLRNGSNFIAESGPSLLAKAGLPDVSLPRVAANATSSPTGTLLSGGNSGRFDHKAGYISPPQTARLLRPGGRRARALPLGKQQARFLARPHRGPIILLSVAGGGENELPTVERARRMRLSLMGRPLINAKRARESIKRATTHFLLVRRDLDAVAWYSRSSSGTPESLKGDLARHKFD